MEGEDPHRRQYEHTNYPPGFIPNLRVPGISGASGGDIYDAQNFRGVQRPNPSGGLRQMHLLGQQTPTPGTTTASGGHAQGLGGYGYGPGQHYTAPHMQGHALQYQPDYLQDSHRQQFTGYTPQTVQGTPQQVQSQSPYDNLPHYHPRQSAANEVLSSQFGGTQYFTPSDSTSASVPASMPQQYTPTDYQPQMPYQPAPMTRADLPSLFPPGMAGFHEAPQTEVVDQPVNWEREYGDSIGEVNENISKGKLMDAGPALLEVSQWLLGRVVEFGLTTDPAIEDMAIHDQRLKLWTDFNLSWLALLQRQKEDTERLLSQNQNPASSENLLTAAYLKGMGKELVRLCDNIERHGLVDYEMGVAEEEIISILMECEELLPNDEAPSETSGAAGPAAHS